MTRTAYSIFGFGTLAHVIAKYLYAQNIAVDNFIVEDTFFTDVEGTGPKCIRLSDFIDKEYFSDYKVVFAVGYSNPEEKQKLYNRLKAIGLNFVNLILSKDCFMHDLELGTGNVFFPEVMIEPSVQIGNGHVFWSRAHICHDTRVGDFNFFATNSVIGGGSKIGDRNFFAFSSIVRNGIAVADDVCVGMGSVITKSIIRPGTYMGVPAKRV